MAVERSGREDDSPNARDAQRSRVIARLCALLGGGYCLCALVLNEFALGWIFAANFSTTARAALVGLDLGLLCLGLVSILGRRRAAVAQLNLAVVAAAASVGVVEAALRVREVRPSEVLIARAELRQIDDFLHHSLVPNVESFSEWGGTIARYSTNNLGFRDRSVRQVAKKLEVRKRVLILGDSFSESLGVEYEEGFPDQLQGLLLANGSPVEVLTAGISSYSPRLEYRQLLQFFKRGYHTDVVVLMLDISDVHDEGSVYVDWDGYSEAERESELRKRELEIELALQQESSLRRLLYPRLLDRIWKSPRESPELPLYLQSPRLRWTEQPEIRSRPWVDVGIAICSVFLDRVDDLCKEKHVDFYLGIYPHPTQLLGSRCIDSEYREIFRKFSRQHGIRLIDLFPTFCELPDWQLYFIGGDIHWNARGHRLVASQLFESIRGGPALSVRSGR